MRTTAPAATLGTRLRHIREEKGMSLASLATKVCVRVPESLWISDETIRRLELDKVPETKADPYVLIHIADVLGCRLSDLSPLVAEHLDSLRDLVNRASACVTAVRGQRDRVPSAA